MGEFLLGLFKFFLKSVLVIIALFLVLVFVGLLVEEDENEMDNNKYNPFTMFDTPRDCVGSGTFKVVEILESGDAIAEEVDPSFSYSEITTDLVVVFIDEGKNSFYDNQKITISRGKCAKQVGVYKSDSYKYRDKTLPVVKIMNK